MRLLYWSDSWWPLVGGVEVLGEQCLRQLRLRGFELRVVTSHWQQDLPDEEEGDGIPVHRFPFHEALRTRRLDLFAKAVQGVQQLKRTWKPDMIHLNFPSPSGIFHLRTADACAAPFLLAMRTHVPAWDTGLDTLSSKLLRQSAWVTANSAATLYLAQDGRHQIEERSSVIHNGMMQPVLAPAPLRFDPPVIAFAGRLVFKKGVDVAIGAMPMVREKFPGARLLIAGDGPERLALERLAEGLGLNGCVDFRGWVPPDQIPAFLNEAAVVTIPSRTMEPFGNIAVEAMQMARPVVATNQGGLPEVIADGETGFLVDPDDANALAERIVRLSLDPAMSARMGEAGRERARLRFSLERYVDEYVALYRKLAG